MGHRPFLKRYLKRDEILFSISSCDAALNDALGLFGVGLFSIVICEMFGFELFRNGSSLFKYVRSKQSKRMNYVDKGKRKIYSIHSRTSRAFHRRLSPYRYHRVHSPPPLQTSIASKSPFVL